jgi:hypothetical protein
MAKKKTTPKKPRGRVNVYSKQIIDEICKAISTSSKSTKTICDSDIRFPDYFTFYHWLGNADKKYDYARQQYARAKDAQADFIVEEIMEISDDGSKDTIKTPFGTIENKEVTNRSRLRVDSRKWVAAHLKPKKYGDKLDLTTGGAEIVVNITGNGKKESNG